MALPAVEDFAQVFPVLPGTRGALGGQVFQQGIKVGTRAVAELISVFEQLPAQSLEFGVVLLLGPSCQACLLQAGETCRKSLSRSADAAQPP